MYLSTTKDLVMKFKIGCIIELFGYIDASFGIHMDGSSRTGVVLYMSEVVIAAWTCKQKLVTKSACESEIVALSDGCTMVLWAREWLIVQGHNNLRPTTIFQDNRGVLALMRNGRSAQQCTKHLHIWYFFVIVIADLMTKPVSGKLFVQLRNRLLGGSTLE